MAATLLVGVASAGLGAAASAQSGGHARPALSGGRGFLAAHAGGTVHLVAQTAGGTLDPQVNYTLQYWQLYQATYDGLVAFHKTTGAPSFNVVPDLAQAMPTISDGGKTYVFKLRSGIKFSNGQAVTVNDVVASFERLFKVANPNAGTWYNVLVGGNACLAKAASCTLSGGVVGNAASGTVTFHLVHPDPEFLDQLAVPFGSILPAATPGKDQGTTPVPGTGAYYFASYDPNKALVMKRNPYFHIWSQDAQPQGYPDEIEMTFGLPVESEVTAVENGQADWVYDTLPSDRLTELSTKYAAQVHVNPLTAIWYLPMNVNIAPFNNVKARQAVNWAIDKNDAVKFYGGTILAQPACTILPPGFPGHTSYCDYTNGSGMSYNGPNLAKAKALVAASGTKGMSVGVVTQNDAVNEAVGTYVVSVLRQIGYNATLKPLSANIQFNYIQNTKNHVQISLSQWYQDYPAASDFLDVLLNCSGFHPGSDNSINIAGLCDKYLDSQEAIAENEELTNPSAANALWGKLDKYAMGTDAPWVPLFNPKLIDFVSKRVGNYEFSRQFYMLVDQLWVQ
jgi:peptide/nickel transport system substrate-binding protein